MTIQETDAGINGADRRWQSLAAILGLIGITTTVVCSGQDTSKVDPAAPEAASSQGEGEVELVITSKDIPFEVGDQAHYAVAVAGGDGPSELSLITTIGKRSVGPRTLLRQAVLMGSMRLTDQWIALGGTELAIYASFDAPLPTLKYPLPLKKGLGYEYQTPRAKVRARVEGPATLKTPGGTFECLLIVEDCQDGAERWQQKLWVAPGVGHVKYIFRVKQDMTTTLVNHKKPRQVKAPPGAHVVSTFDVGDPMGSHLFPRAMWQAGAGGAMCSSVADIDPSGGAAGTPFCLRWTYHIRETWADVALTPSGVWEVPADLSRYDSISFYIRGLVPGQCMLTFITKSAEEQGKRFSHVPVQYGTEWQKIVIALKTQPQLKAADLTQVDRFTIGIHTEGEASGVIFIDEIMFHAARKMGEF